MHGRGPWLAALLLMTLLPAAPAMREDPPERWVVVAEDAGVLPAVRALAHAHGASVPREDAALGLSILLVPPRAAAGLAADAARVPGVTSVAPDVRMAAAFVPDDPRYPDQWGPGAVGLPAAWDAGLGSRNVTVALVDSGVDLAHPDLAPNVCALGPDYVRGDAVPDDEDGHGTGVAGVVAAALDNGVGIAGALNACLMPVKFMVGFSGWASDAASGIAWATDRGADVATLSFGGSPSDALAQAVAYAHARGVVLVAAAGNGYCSPVSHPAAYDEVVSVGALAAPGDARADLSNCGARLDVSAPGRGILTTGLGGGYVQANGTSVAAPFVAGAAALLLSHRADLTPDEVRCILRSTATDIAAPGDDRETGAGRLDVAAAVARLACTAPPAPTHVAAAPGDRAGRIVVEWRAPAGAAVAAYRVHRTDASGATVLAGTTNGTRFTDDGLPTGATFTYRVAAANAGGESRQSVDAAAATPHPPAAPRDLRASPGDAAYPVRLQWLPPGEAGAVPVASYRVYRSVAGGPESLRAEVATTTHGDACPTLLTCSYRVSAVNFMGEGPRSNPASVLVR